MSVIVSASQAAILVGRHERIVRGWIISKKLKATKSSDGQRWQINTDDLMQVSFVDDEHKAAIRRWADEETKRGKVILTSQDNMSQSLMPEAIPIYRVAKLETLFNELKEQHTQDYNALKAQDQQLEEQQNSIIDRIAGLDRDLRADLKTIFAILEHFGFGHST